MDPARDALAGRIPVTLLTGFLGAGKTTLLARLVRHPEMNRVAVVINEIGEIGLDHDLVAMSSERVALLANGCICCSVRTDLQDTLRQLFGDRRAGTIPDFDRVVIETTGLADPAPVVQTLGSDTMLAAHYRLDGVVTLVDAVNGLAQLDRQPEAVKQVALADRLFVTKGDIADAQQVRELEAALATLNPGARVEPLVRGEIEPRELTGLGLASARAGAQTLTFLGEPLAGAGSGGERTLGRAPRHGSIRTLALRFERPFTWPAFSAALELLANLRGPDLLRMKGIVNVAGRPVVVQGVQHVFHEPVELDRWPSGDTDTRLVFITRDIDAATIRDLLAAVAATAGNPPPRADDVSGATP